MLPQLSLEMHEQVRIAVPMVPIASRGSSQQHHIAMTPWAAKEGLGWGFVSLEPFLKE